MARLMPLLVPVLLVTVCSVNSTTQCKSDEFKYEDLCCQRCSAGTYLINPCKENGGQSECASCEPKYFLAHNNSLPECIPCSMCRDDQEEVATCSSTSDRKCHCKEGTYCNSGNCAEKCHSCSSCPDDRIIRKCNATMDTVCNTSGSEPGLSGNQCLHLTIVIPITIVATIIITATVIIIIPKLICYCRNKRQKNSQLVSTTPSQAMIAFLKLTGFKNIKMPEEHGH